MIFMVSENPLFREIILESLAQLKDQCIELEPDQALPLLCEMQPEIIIIDKSINPLIYEGLLREARELAKTRTIIVNPQDDEMLLLDTRRTTLKKIEDIMEAI